MSINFTKSTTIAGTVLLLSLSTSSFASGIYGSVGYGHHPIHIVVGYNGHGKHYGHRRHHYKHYNHKRHYNHHRRHYYKHAYNYGHKARHHYNQPRKYCRSGY
ncbi:MAG: hypothetical protein R8G33_04810 [Gammaproteobacteria bacterium]|nr:hypothetical protein [Gammaproteobacteria bacterium]